MEYTRFSILSPITATIRRRLPRLYSSHRADAENQSSGDLQHGLIWGSDTPPSEESVSPVKYETGSGLRWNRVVPAYNLLRNAGYEAQQPQADGRLARSLYINALMYLLDALPSDLTAEESAMLQYRLPDNVKSSIVTSSQPYATQLETSMSPRAIPPARSYLHRLLASIIVQIFLLARFLLPYFRLLLRQVYEYERSHRITQRIVMTTLDAADELGKKSVDIGSAVCRFNQGRVGVAVANLASWWVEGIAGGIYEGVGEGMMHMAQRSSKDLQKSFNSPAPLINIIDQLHLEFSSLRHAAPLGVYVSLAPGDPTLWSGVIFVRSGPYASAILRFQIRFPDIYPDLPPLVTFATDLDERRPGQRDGR
ncbi:uncharacterized protein N7503_011955 [Penicillium pulvis]|uniref:uncharacterized protein n=1 Tax=Penicillium pulvis TaxID=1562058 RepID=UPI0025491CF7|nr:uncharacterized protein N7503_011955 [Penicillium pulvis]KAJ5786743.1 hypothetical protein N7503_011955 [Penicillium pulvis]